MTLATDARRPGSRLTAGRLAALVSLLACPDPAPAATLARLATADGAIESVAIASLSVEACRFAVSEQGSLLRPAGDAAAPSAGAAGSQGLPQLRMIEYPAQRLRAWGRAAPAPVGPQALFAPSRDADPRGPGPLVVAGRLEVFDGQALVVAGGDLGAVRLPAALVDRWVATASVASRRDAAGGPNRDRPRLLLVNGDVVEPASLRVADGVATLVLPIGPEEAPATADARSEDARTPTRMPVTFPLERLLAVEPAASPQPSMGRPRSETRIVVVLADGSRIPVRGLSVSPPPSVTGIPTRRTATLLPAWGRDDGRTTLAPEPLACDADAIAAVEFHPEDPTGADRSPSP